MAWWQGLKVLVALIRPPSLLCLNLDGSSPRAYLFSSGWWAQFVGKCMGLSITMDIFFNRSQAVLSVGKMGEEARDGCKKIC